MKKVVIVGSGIGSLSTAIRLIALGYSVDIYEKNDYVGGKLGFFKKNGHTIDLTASIVLDINKYKELFRILDKNMSDYISVKRLDTTYKVFYNDNSCYEFSDNPYKLFSTVESINKSDGIKCLSILQHSYMKYNTIDKLFLDTPINQLTVKKLIKLIKFRPWQSSYDYISKYITDEKLKQFFLFQCMYTGASPYTSSSIFTLIPALAHYKSIWQFDGGIYNYIDALRRLIIEHGGNIHLNSPVQKILTHKNKAKGILVNHKFIESDIVICNTDFSYSINKLIDTDYNMCCYKKNYNYSPSVFILRLGLKNNIPSLSTHNLIFNKNFHRNLHKAFLNKLPPSPHLYIYYPDNSRHIMNIMVRVPNLKSKIDWNKKTVCYMEQKILRILKNTEGMENIEQNISFKDTFTPKDLKSYTNSSYGSAFGFVPSGKQMLIRPNIKLKYFNNLYFVGDTIQYGSGISVVMNCSKIVVNKIIKDDISKIKK